MHHLVTPNNRVIALRTLVVWKLLERYSASAFRDISRRCAECNLVCAGCGGDTMTSPRAGHAIDCSNECAVTPSCHAATRASADQITRAHAASDMQAEAQQPWFTSQLHGATSHGATSHSATSHGATSHAVTARQRVHVPDSCEHAESEDRGSCERAECSAAARRAATPVCNAPVARLCEVQQRTHRICEWVAHKLANLVRVFCR